MLSVQYFLLLIASSASGNNSMVCALNGGAEFEKIESPDETTMLMKNMSSRNGALLILPKVSSVVSTDWIFPNKYMSQSQMFRLEQRFEVRMMKIWLITKLR